MVEWKLSTSVGWGLATLFSPRIYFNNYSIASESRKRLHYVVLCLLALLTLFWKKGLSHPILNKIVVAYLPLWLRKNLIGSLSHAELSKPAAESTRPVAETLELPIDIKPTDVPLSSQSSDIPLPPYKRHAYSDTLSQALALVQQIHPLNSGWESVQTQQGVSISTRPLPGLPINMVRGDAFFAFKDTGIEGTVEEWLSVIRSTAARKIWDHRFLSGTLLEYLSPDEFISHSSQKGVFPVAGRDFVTLNTLVHPSEANQGAGYYISCSLPSSHPKAPPSGHEGRVRGDLRIAAWKVCLESKDGVQGMSVSYLVGVDVKGNIPQSIIKMVQTQTPLCINEVYKYLKSFGPMPFIIKSSEGPSHPLSVSLSFKQMEEAYDPNTQTYTIHSTLMYGSDVEDSLKETGSFAKIAIALPSRIYSVGAHVATTLTTQDGAEAPVMVEGKWYPSKTQDVVSSLSSGILFMRFSLTSSLSAPVPSKSKNSDDEEDEEGIIVSKNKSSNELISNQTISSMSTLAVPEWQPGEKMQCSIKIQTHYRFELNHSQIEIDD